MVKNSGQAVSITGYFVWWTFRSLLIPRTKLRQIFQDVGLDINVPDPNPRSAFLMAVREIRRVQASHKVLIRCIRRGKQLAFGLVDETIDEKALSLDYSHSATLIFDCETCRMTSDKPHRAFDLVQAKYDTFMNCVNSYDMRVLVQRTLNRWRKLMVRESGWVYFVPVAFEDKLQQLVHAVELIGGDCSIDAIPQVDAESTKKTIYKAFMHELHTKVAKFKDEVESDKYLTEKGWKTKLAEFRRLRDHISFYSDQMKFQAEDLDQEIEGLQNLVQQKLESEDE